MSLEVKQLLEIDRDTLDTITEWMYAWWGSEEGHTYEAVESFMKHSLQKDRLPQTYGLFLDGTIIGLYQLTQWDFFPRPDIYPWLANVYIDHPYRNQGYGRVLLESVKSVAQAGLTVDTLYLITKHIGLYEKFGWQFLGEIDSYQKDHGMERLYQLKLR